MQISSHWLGIKSELCLASMKLLYALSVHSANHFKGHSDKYELNSSRMRLLHTATMGGSHNLRNRPIPSSLYIKPLKVCP